MDYIETNSSAPLSYLPGSVGGQFNDPEFAGGFRSDVAFEDLSTMPAWLTATYDFDVNFEKDAPREAGRPDLTSTSPIEETPFDSDSFYNASPQPSRAVSPVPNSPFDLVPGFPYDDLSGGEENTHEVEVEEDLVPPVRQKASTKSMVPPKKVKAASGVSPKAKEKVAKTKGMNNAVAVVPTLPAVPFRAPCSKMAVPALPSIKAPPVPVKSSAPPSPVSAHSSSSSVLSEEERKERNKIAAQKYRQKLREQASDAQNKCSVLLEEQKMLHMAIVQEREKIKEIRELLMKHGLLPSN